MGDRGSHPGAEPGWIVLREGEHRRWGGEVRRHHVFGRLAERTAARIVEGGWRPGPLRRAVLGPLGALPGALADRVPRRGPRPRFASSEKLRDALLDAAVALTDPVAVAVYDDPVAQSRALGVTLEADWLAELARRQRRNVEAFRWLVVPTRSFANLAGLDLDRVIVGGNGTDTSRVRPGPWPDVPCVGILSAAAPGRGLELLVEAARIARLRVPDLRLRMWLVSTGAATDGYLAGLRASVAGESWVEIGGAAYDELGRAAASAMALCIPHPPNEYMDVALPVKLFDSLAVGRPLVVTPRTETAAVVAGRGVGVVAGGDTADALAEAIVALVDDPALAQRLGAAARAIAEREFDWRVVGDRIAREVLAREGLVALGGPDDEDRLSSP
jgi:glycosyltransferase involved in cell wall biosynthesis